MQGYEIEMPLDEDEQKVMPECNCETCLTSMRSGLMTCSLTTVLIALWHFMQPVEFDQAINYVNKIKVGQQLHGTCMWTLLVSSVLSSSSHFT